MAVDRGDPRPVRQRDTPTDATDDASHSRVDPCVDPGAQRQDSPFVGGADASRGEAAATASGPDTHRDHGRLVSVPSLSGGRSVGPARTAFRALGTTAEVVVVRGERLADAVTILRKELAAIDATCSRFRADSEISRLHARAGRPVRISPLLAEALGVALQAARQTDGLVDPTVGTAVRDLGYDDDFEALPRHDDRPLPEPVAAPGWWRISLDEHERFVLLPHGISLDLGATAKALAADRAATRIAARLGTGALVNLGGDLRTAGAAPEGGWRVLVHDDHGTSFDDLAADGPVVHIREGAVATSSTAVRAWSRDGRILHHIVDPRTGQSAEPVWQTVTVAAATCVEANTASTAAIVLGAGAVGWLGDQGLPSRLAAHDGTVVTVGEWPDEQDDPWGEER